MIMAKTLDPEAPDLASLVRRGDTVLWGQANAEPLILTRALMAQRHAIGRFRVFLGINNSDTCQPEHADCVDFLAYCGSGSNRVLDKTGKLDIVPCHYSHLARAIRSGALPIDVLLLQLAPADAEGRYSLSLAHEYLVPALDAARVVIAEINEQAPWTCGERYLRDEDIDYLVHTSHPPLASARAEPNETERAIARNVAELVDDGATLQFGLGALPEAILCALADRRDLGVHSGTIGDTVAELMDRGTITNARKSIDRGVTVTGMMMGGPRIHAYAQRNPRIQFRSTEYTHDADVLARIERFVALNSAIEVDLSGQINAEVAGGRYVGAVGGALDFLRGAHRSKGGLPIVALPSMAGSASRIVTRLSGPVSTPRSDAGLIVTEHGVADLRGLSLRQRRERLIAIAHPDFREALELSYVGLQPDLGVERRADARVTVSKEGSKHEKSSNRLPLRTAVGTFDGSLRSNRRQCEPAERCGRRLSGGRGRQARGARAATAGLVARMGRGGLPSSHHGHRRRARGGKALRPDRTLVR